MISILGADGKSYGPVNADQIRRWLAEGRATLQTLAQREGGTSWEPLGSFPEFAVQTPAEAPQSPGAVLPPPLPAAKVSESGETDTLIDQTTGETQAASRLARLMASLLDTVLSLFFALPGLFLLTIGVLRDDTPLQELIEKGFPGHETAVGLMMVGVIIPAIAQIWLLASRGQTVGKYLLQIRIVNVEDEGKVGFLRVVVLRSFVPGLIGTLPYVGAAFTLLDVLFIFREDRRCLHDHIAGTKVIRTE